MFSHLAPLLTFNTETAMKGNSVMVLGEITTKAKVDYVQTVKDTLERIGYDDEENGMCAINLLKCLTAYISLYSSN